jgi:hypothetical protein
VPYFVTVNGQPKGEVYRFRGRWRWFKAGRGTEQYSRGTSLQDIAYHISRLCRVPVDQVQLDKRETR